MNKGLIVVFAFIFGMLSAQQSSYYQQFAKYKMDIDVDAPNFTYKGNQTLTYTNNSSDELKVVYFHLYWNAFKPGSMMDQRVQNQGKNGDSRLQINGISRLASIPKGEEGAQNIHWIKQ
ncbi:MAG: M1 family peptidase, partial [Chryseobacterium sp.]|nr:M1 family peptidase [Chryseobacterium sp.]